MDQIAKLRKEASDIRSRMIKENRHHAADDLPKAEYGDLESEMPAAYRKQLNRVKKLPKGKKALKLYERFWGLPYPTEIKEFDIPGPKDKTVVMVGMGWNEEAHLADGPEGKDKKHWTLKGKRIPALDADGKKVFLLKGKDSKAAKRKLKKLGYAPKTIYIPTPDMEKAGTKKKKTIWVHHHNKEEGGKYPEVFEDQAGNLILNSETLWVDKQGWLRG